MQTQTQENIDIKMDAEATITLRADEVMFALAAIAAVPQSISQKPARRLADKLQDFMEDRIKESKAEKEKIND